MVRIQICDNSYNKLTFWYEDVCQALDLMQTALREGYKVEVTTTQKDEERTLDF